MKRTGFILATLTAVVFAGCSKDNLDVDEKLVRIDRRLKNIETKIDKIGTGAPGRPGAARAGQRPPRPPGPDPKAVYSVNIDGAPYKGAKFGKVTIVEAFDFAWPYCLRVGPTVDTLLKDYEGDLKVVYKNMVIHPGSATIPAKAACAAGFQGKFAPMEHLIWTKGFSAGRNLSLENMTKLAGEVGLDMGKWKADMNGRCTQVLAKDQQQLRAVGARGTPAFFINGRFLSGARPVDQFKKIVDEELKKANDRIKKGAKVQTYYTEFVLKQGKKKL